MEKLTPDELRTLSMKLGQTFDHEKKDLEAYTIGARTVIQLALHLAEVSDEQLKSQYKNVALFTSYNLSAGCWPAWDKESFAVEAQYLDLGLEFAEFNIELAEALEVGPERRKNGWWIKGAHLACRLRYAEAQHAFEKSRKFAAEAGDGDAELMCQGWEILMAQLLGDETAQKALVELKAALTSRGEDGAFYAGQYDPFLAYVSRSDTK